MTTNRYFSHNNPDNSNEQNLIHGFYTETIQQKGYDYIYLPRQFAKVDDFFGEDVLSNFSTTHTIEMYIENTDAFEGPGDIYMQLGLSVKDQATLAVARRRFQEETGMDRPREGDLIFVPLNKALFEIRFVEHEDQFYPLATLPTFKMQVELFDYGNQDFNTGNPAIDNVEQLQTDIETLETLGIDEDLPHDSKKANEKEADFIDEPARKGSIWGDY